ncbi:GDSL-type esterase/lipase family protein [Bradyrhizobium sp. SK17]|uniref:SGNH/GDSL hydrolase family protein n=1 Tax=Bradyrhizobium sp. SK17 TaxID=2057741 RepID=UPI0012FD5458|nr:GDSL-type esterase/lipase family protein [Bradyrhizobium sp. SK17]
MKLTRHLLILLAVLLGLSTAASAATCPAAPAAPVATTTPAARPDAWVPQQEELRRRLAAQSFDAITFGDSIMQGWSEARLQQAMGMSVLNAGFGQDGTEHLLWWLKTYDWQKQSPHDVLLLIGTNDIGYPTCDIAWGILTAVKTVHATFPKAHVMVVSILPRGTNLMGADDKIRAVNATLHQASASARFAFLDVHDAFECGHKTPCPLFQPDLNLHLTSAGYDLLTELLRKSVAAEPHRN